jgi:hypothetical protein
MRAPLTLFKAGTGCRLFDFDKLKFPDQSLIASSKGGRFWHVLVPDPGVDEVATRRQIQQGVLCIKCGTLNRSRSAHDTGGGASFETRVEHEPEEHNYRHCELHLFENGRRVTAAEYKAAPSDQKGAITKFRSYIRAILFQAMREGEISLLVQPIGAEGSDPLQTPINCCLIGACRPPSE